MNNDEKMFYTLTDAEEYLHITSVVLARKLTLFNIETKKLPGSKKDYIAARDVRLIERSIKEPCFYA